MNESKLQNYVLGKFKIEEFEGTVQEFEDYDAYMSSSQYFVDKNGQCFKASLHDNGWKSCLTVTEMTEEQIKAEYNQYIALFEKMVELSGTLTNIEKGLLVSIIMSEKEIF